MKKKYSNPADDNSGDLFPKILKFCVEFLVDRNGKQAAIRAGYSARTAEQQASRLLSNVKVKAEIDRLLKEQEGRTKLNADRVLSELWHLATVDLSQAYNLDGTFKNIHDIPEDVRRAIAGVEVEELFDGAGRDKEKIGITSKVKFWDKPRCLEILAKHFKLLTDVVKHEGLEDLAEKIAAARQRRQAHG